MSPSNAMLLKKRKRNHLPKNRAALPSSSTKQSAQQRVREQYTQGITSPTGLAPAGVVGTRSRCCPAATVRAAVVFACGFRCCFAEIDKNKNKIDCYYAAAVAEFT